MSLIRAFDTFLGVFYTAWEVLTYLIVFFTVAFGLGIALQGAFPEYNLVCGLAAGYTAAAIAKRTTS